MQFSGPGAGNYRTGARSFDMERRGGKGSSFSDARQRSELRRRVCWKFAQTGTCKDGIWCKYAHCEMESSHPQAPGSLASSGVAEAPVGSTYSTFQGTGNLDFADQPASSRTRTRNFDEESRNRKGSSFSYARRKPELRTRICRNFAKTGTCKDGTQCQFAHCEVQLRPSQASTSPASSGVTEAPTGSSRRTSATVEPPPGLTQQPASSASSDTVDQATPAQSSQSNGVGEEKVGSMPAVNKPGTDLRAVEVAVAGFWHPEFNVGVCCHCGQYCGHRYVLRL